MTQWLCPEEEKRHTGGQLGAGRFSPGGPGGLWTRRALSGAHAHGRGELSGRQMQRLSQACLLVRSFSGRAAHTGCSFPGPLRLHKPHFSCFYQQWQDLQIYKSINVLYSPISHFNNTRPCLQSVDSFSLAPKPGAVGWGREGGAGRARGAASRAPPPPLSWLCPVCLQSLRPGPVPARLAGLHRLARSVQKLQAWRPRVYSVNEHLVVRRILVVK